MCLLIERRPCFTVCPVTDESSEKEGAFTDNQASGNHDNQRAGRAQSMRQDTHTNMYTHCTCAHKNI